jgi:hypothetical protein
MEKKNIPRSQTASALAGTLAYPGVMAYKRHLCGVAQHIVTVVAWTWTWTTRACVVPGAHKEEVFGPLKPGNKVRQQIRHVNAYNYPHIY